MSNNVALALTIVRTLNTLITLSREMQISFASLKKVMDKAETEGREVTVADLEEIRSDSDRAHQSLKDVIAEYERDQ